MRRKNDILNRLPHTNCIYTVNMQSEGKFKIKKRSKIIQNDWIQDLEKLQENGIPLKMAKKKRHVQFLSLLTVFYIRSLYLANAAFHTKTI